MFYIVLLCPRSHTHTQCHKIIFYLTTKVYFFIFLIYCNVFLKYCSCLTKSVSRCTKKLQHTVWKILFIVLLPGIITVETCFGRQLLAWTIDNAALLINQPSWFLNSYNFLKTLLLIFFIMFGNLKSNHCILNVQNKYIGGEKTLRFETEWNWMELVFYLGFPSWLIVH